MNLSISKTLGSCNYSEVLPRPRLSVQTSTHPCVHSALPLTHSLTHSHTCYTHTCPHSITHCLTHTHTLSQTHTCTDAPNTHSHTHSLTRKLTLTLTHSHTQAHTCSHTASLSTAVFLGTAGAEEVGTATHPSRAPHTQERRLSSVWLEGSGSQAWEKGAAPDLSGI